MCPYVTICPPSTRPTASSASQVELPAATYSSSHTFTPYNGVKPPPSTPSSVLSPSPTSPPPTESSTPSASSPSTDTPLIPFPATASELASQMIASTACVAHAINTSSLPLMSASCCAIASPYELAPSVPCSKTSCSKDSSPGPEPYDRAFRPCLCTCADGDGPPGQACRRPALPGRSRCAACPDNNWEACTECTCLVDGEYPDDRLLVQPMLRKPRSVRHACSDLRKPFTLHVTLHLCVTGIFMRCERAGLFQGVSGKCCRVKYGIRASPLPTSHLQLYSSSLPRSLQFCAASERHTSST